MDLGPGHEVPTWRSANRVRGGLVPGRHQQVRDNLRVKEVTLQGTPGIRWVVCHNPDEAAKDKAQREDAIALNRPWFDAASILAKDARHAEEVPDRPA